MPADPIVPTSPVGAADQPTVPVSPQPAPAQPPAPVPAQPPAPVPAQPPAPVPAQAKPPTWAARAAVPGTAPPGGKKAAQTRPFTRYAETGTGRVVVAPRRSGARRFFVALLSAVLILAVPVVSAYVTYKLASGENPFVWPPTMDLSHVF